jgi:hypothetical protein
MSEGVTRARRYNGGGTTWEDYHGFSPHPPTHAGIGGSQCVRVQHWPLRRCIRTRCETDRAVRARVCLFGAAPPPSIFVPRVNSHLRDGAGKAPSRLISKRPGGRIFGKRQISGRVRAAARNYSRLRSHLCAGNAMIGGKSGPDLDGMVGGCQSRDRPALGEERFQYITSWQGTLPSRVRSSPPLESRIGGGRERPGSRGGVGQSRRRLSALRRLRSCRLCGKIN